MSWLPGAMQPSSQPGHHLAATDNYMYTHMYTLFPPVLSNSQFGPQCFAVAPPVRYSGNCNENGDQAARIAENQAQEDKQEKMRKAGAERTRQCRERKAMCNLRAKLRDAGVHFTTKDINEKFLEIDIQTMADHVEKIPEKSWRPIFQRLTKQNAKGISILSMKMSWQRHQATIEDALIIEPMQRLKKKMLAFRGKGSADEDMELDAVHGICSRSLADKQRIDDIPLEQECHSDTGAVSSYQHNTHQPISVLLALTHDSTLTVWPFSWKLSVLRDSLGGVGMTPEGWTAQASQIVSELHDRGYHRNFLNAMRQDGRWSPDPKGGGDANEIFQGPLTPDSQARSRIPRVELRFKKGEAVWIVGDLFHAGGKWEHATESNFRLHAYIQHKTHANLSKTTLARQYKERHLLEPQQLDKQPQDTQPLPAPPPVSERITRRSKSKNEEEEKRDEPEGVCVVQDESRTRRSEHSAGGEQEETSRSLGTAGGEIVHPAPGSKPSTRSNQLKNPLPAPPPVSERITRRSKSKNGEEERRDEPGGVCVVQEDTPLRATRSTPLKRKR